MIRERIAEPVYKPHLRDLALDRFPRAGRTFHPGLGIVSLLVVLVLIAMPVVALAGDPTGAATGDASAVAAAKPGEPTISRNCQPPSATQSFRSTSCGHLWPASWSCLCRLGSRWRKRDSRAPRTPPIPWR